MPDPINIRERLPIVPYAAHTQRALRFSQETEIWYGLGRVSAWPADAEGNEEDSPNFIPPEPDMTATTLDELIGLKKAARVVMVVPSSTGEIEYYDSRWTTVTEEQAVEQQGRWVMVEAMLYYTDFPVTQYRQIGLFSGVVKASGVPTDTQVLLPSQIQSVGALEVLDNRHVVTRQADTKDTYRMIIEF